MTCVLMVRRKSPLAQAFADEWTWNADAARAYQDVVEQGGRVSQAIQAHERWSDSSVVTRARDRRAAVDYFSGRDAPCVSRLYYDGTGRGGLP